MTERSAAVTSDVVRQRLESLFAQLQSVPDGEPTLSPGRGAIAEVMSSERGEADGDGSKAVSRAPSGREPERSIDADWLAGLRASVPAERRDRAPATSSPAGPKAAVAPTTPVSAAAAQLWQFTREHLVTVAVVVAVALGWSVYSVFQARSTPIAEAVPVTQTTPAPPVASSTSAAKQLVIHVIGAVRRPGVVSLPEGARVNDAIAAAGGLSARAASGELNLAQPLTDGVQLKIGTKTHPGGWIRSGADEPGTGVSRPGGSGSGGAGAGGGAPGAQNAKVSLNTATASQLDTLPGVGPVTAQKILDWRAQHGKFSAITELQEVDGIGPKTYADLADRVRL